MQRKERDEEKNLVKVHEIERKMNEMNPKNEVVG
jgi:hypothetical protein